jgi:hypothetical protein
MSKFKVGDTVRWMRAVEWKLKNTVGTIKQIILPSRDELVEYDVTFAFGTIRLREKQIQPAKSKDAA